MQLHFLFASYIIDPNDLAHQLPLEVTAKFVEVSNCTMDKEERNNEQPTSPKGRRSWMIWIYLMVMLFLLFQFSQNYLQSTQSISWNELERNILPHETIDLMVVVNQEEVEIYIKQENLGSSPHDDFSENAAGPHYKMTIGSIETFERKLQDAEAKYQYGQAIDIQYEKRVNWFGNLLVWLIPFALILFIWLFILRSVGGKMGGKGMGGGIFDFGKSKAVLFDQENKSKVTFEEVAGLEAAKMEVREIVEFLKNPERYTSLGAKIPKGVMLVGPPGTGKTLMAKAVAGEAQVPFFSISGSEFVEMFVGVGASRVRDLFRKAKEKSPSIIFIDEIDAIGRSRGNVASLQANDERESTLNQLLTEMDGFGTNTGVIVLAATNRPDILDKALLRPGRFDRHIYLELPTLEERIEIFKVHLRSIKLQEGIDLRRLAAQTPGFSGADIANVCNEAALIAARKNKQKVESVDFNDAADRIVAGLERKGKIISVQERRTVAYHEAGHATVSWYLKHADELLKVSIVPRGKSLGAAWYLPEEHSLLTKSQLFDRICMALGGRAAELMIFNEVSSGALDDLEKVTKQAYTMVMYYGLSDKLGNISFYDSSGQQDMSLKRPYSEETAQIIDREVQRMVAEAFDQTSDILRAHRKELTELAELLLKKEVVNQEELIGIFGPRMEKSADKSDEVISLGLT